MTFDNNLTMIEFVQKLEGILNHSETASSPIRETLNGPNILAMFVHTDESPYGPVVTALKT